MGKYEWDEFLGRNRKQFNWLWSLIGALRSCLRRCYCLKCVRVRGVTMKKASEKTRIVPSDRFLLRRCRRSAQHSTPPVRLVKLHCHT